MNETNGELHSEVAKLKNKLGGVEKLYVKYQQSKKNYTKLLMALEHSEMVRRQLNENVKAVSKKVHKLKKEKRQLQEECAKTFGNTHRHVKVTKPSVKKDEVPHPKVKH